MKVGNSREILILFSYFLLNVIVLTSIDWNNGLVRCEISSSLNNEFSNSLQDLKENIVSNDDLEDPENEDSEDENIFDSSDGSASKDDIKSKSASLMSEETEELENIMDIPASKDKEPPGGKIESIEKDNVSTTEADEESEEEDDDEDDSDNVNKKFLNDFKNKLEKNEQSENVKLTQSLGPSFDDKNSENLYRKTEKFNIGKENNIENTEKIGITQSLYPDFTVNCFNSKDANNDSSQNLPTFVYPGNEKITNSDVSGNIAGFLSNNVKNQGFRPVMKFNAPVGGFGNNLGQIKPADGVYKGMSTGGRISKDLPQKVVFGGVNAIDRKPVQGQAVSLTDKVLVGKIIGTKPKTNKISVPTLNVLGRLVKNQEKPAALTKTRILLKPKETNVPVTPPPAQKILVAKVAEPKPQPQVLLKANKIAVTPPPAQKILVAKVAEPKPQPQVLLKANKIAVTPPPAQKILVAKVMQPHTQRVIVTPNTQKILVKKVLEPQPKQNVVLRPQKIAVTPPPVQKILVAKVAEPKPKPQVLLQANKIAVTPPPAQKILVAKVAEPKPQPQVLLKANKIAVTPPPAQKILVAKVVEPQQKAKIVLPTRKVVDSPQKKLFLGKLLQPELTQKPAGRVLVKKLVKEEPKILLREKRFTPRQVLVQKILKPREKPNRIILGRKVENDRPILVKRAIQNTPRLIPVKVIGNKKPLIRRYVKVSGGKVSESDDEDDEDEDSRILVNIPYDRLSQGNKIRRNEPYQLVEDPNARYIPNVPRINKTNRIVPVLSSKGARVGKNFDSDISLNNNNRYLKLIRKKNSNGDVFPVKKHDSNNDNEIDYLREEIVLKPKYIGPHQRQNYMSKGGFITPGGYPNRLIGQSGPRLGIPMFQLPPEQQSNPVNNINGIENLNGNQHKDNDHFGEFSDNSMRDLRDTRPWYSQSTFVLSFVGVLFLIIVGGIIVYYVSAQN
ncbi:signal peptide plus transmembrane domain or GPI anchor [Cryptosporidium ryanae]|uniref:signal peptide plus transmembrane domain or GPI anchor n=1 Tax=Cryptosporidium ryanae TaxID=515981 RepID=UPI00351A5283|nr:signal peptide plus transmembrane domain or GPI anchor [Cryptosporidium ryanae]